MHDLGHGIFSHLRSSTFVVMYLCTWARLAAEGNLERGSRPPDASRRLPLFDESQEAGRTDGDRETFHALS